MSFATHVDFSCCIGFLSDFYANLPIAATDYLKCPFNLKSPAGSNSIEDCVRDKQLLASSRRLLASVIAGQADYSGYTATVACAGAILVIVFLLCAAFSSSNAPKATKSKIVTFAAPITNPREMDGFYDDSAFDGGNTPIVLPATPLA